MFSRTKIAAGLAGVASICLIAGTSLGAVSASASSDVGACVVHGTATITGETQPTVPRSGHATSGSFAGVTIICAPPYPASDDGGTWTGVSAVFGSTSEDCAGTIADGSGHFTGGTAPNGDHGDGQIDNDSTAAGSFTYTRAGTVVHVSGNIDTSNPTAADPSDESEVHHFHAVLNFTPTDGPCVNGTDPTHADLDGTAVLTEDDSD